MATIKAPFNFVPLSEKVFFPEWAGQISQDIPFEDGVSGTIELKITAESPIFVRNGHTKEQAQNDNVEYTSFSKINDRYFIPATSIKGAIRNVLEIMSFGKMSQISNNRYSIRDLQLKKYMNYFQNSDVHCGWMRKKGETVTITDNGIPRRISHAEIDKLLKTDFCNIFSKEDLLKDDSKRSPLYKYSLTHNKLLRFKFKELPLNPNNTVDKRLKVVEDKNGIEGNIVFTGQPSYRQNEIKKTDGTITKKSSGKFYEFVFLNEFLRTIILNSEEENGIYKDFSFVYKDSDEWKYWKKMMEKGEQVPVFFSVDNNGKLLHLGLSYLYKLPYPKRIKEYLYDDHKKSKLDLSECIFGVTAKDSLKGRVQFSHAFTEQKPSKDKISPYLGSPKPTYYPIYLKQNGENGYMINKERGIFFSTMLNNNAELKGWKRYPVQNEWEEDFIPPKGQEDNTNPFYPMTIGSEFIANVRFHNLRRVELGALLNAISLRTGYFHSIGFAKALGFGKVKIEIVSVNGFDFGQIDSIKKEFLDLMSQEIDDYSTSPQIRELWAMMRPQNLTTPLEYMDLKDFVNCKKQNFNKNIYGEYLPYYTELIKKEIKTNITKTEEHATVSVLQGTIKQARLDGDNRSLPLDLRNNKVRLKVGDSIFVEKVMRSGRVEKLVFKKKM